MAPTSKLIAAAAIVLIPLCTLVGVMPATAIPIAVLCAVICGVVLWDARGAQRQVALVRASVASQLRWPQGREAILSVAVENRSASPAHLRVAVPTPPGVSSSIDVQPADVAPGHSAFLEWPCRGERLGEHTLRRIPMELRSNLGLWNARIEQPVECLLRVFPDMRDPATLALLNRRQAGAKLMRTVGQGREFEKLRDYAPGDSFEDMHWKATARRGRPVVKQYQAEHAQEIYLVVDHSRLAAREHTYEHFIGAALHMALAAEAHGDRFGMITFSDRIHLFLPPSSGTEHFRACREAIYNLRPRTVNPDFRQVLAGIQTQVRRRSLLVFFTCLDDPLLAETFSREVPVVARKHLVTVHTMQTSGTRPLFQDEPPASLDGAYQALAGQLLWNRLRTLELDLAQRGVGMRIVTPETIRARATEAYLDIKRRQLL